MALFLLGYWLLMRREVRHQIVRLYLLSNKLLEASVCVGTQITGLSVNNDNDTIFESAWDIPQATSSKMRISFMTRLRTSTPSVIFTCK